jgi:hypothetical protein
MYDEREKKRHDRCLRSKRLVTCVDFYGGEHLMRMLAKLPEFLYGMDGIYVCMHVCMYLCMCVCVCMYVCIYMYVCMYACMHVCV